MTEIIVSMKKLDKVLPHSNADRLELAIIDGWQVVVRKGDFKDGDFIVYLPIDCILPDKLIKHFALEFVEKNHGRIKAIKLRKEPSYGLCLPVTEVEAFIDRKIILGENLRDDLGIKKFSEPEKEIKSNVGFKRFNVKKRHSLWVLFKYFLYRKIHKFDASFNQYSDFGNLRDKMDTFEGETVTVHEKIHGMNARFGYQCGFNKKSSIWSILKKNQEPKFFVGSHHQERNVNDNSRWSKIFNIFPVKELLINLFEERKAQQVILFGEIYGKHIQDLEYSKPDFDFIAFDILIDGVYLDKNESEEICKKYAIQFVPKLYEGVFDFDLIKRLDGTKSIIDNKTIKEGVVITSDKRFGMLRKMKKYVFDAYLTRENGTEFN